jgi:tRNA(Arg) A34 adenosine deaminase TadA
VAVNTSAKKGEALEEKISRRLMLGGALALLSSQLQLPSLGNKSAVPDNLDHERFMRLAINQGLKVPACPFGSVIVNMKTKEVVAEGWVRVNKNPIWHGEMTAINNCPDGESGFNWKDVCLYTTGESCPMCQSAIIWTGMPLVVYGSSMPFLQSCKFGEINIRANKVIDASLKGKCQIIGGVLEMECNQLFVDARNLG